MEEERGRKVLTVPPKHRIMAPLSRGSSNCRKRSLIRRQKTSCVLCIVHDSCSRQRTLTIYVEQCYPAARGKLQWTSHPSEAQTLRSSHYTVHSHLMLRNNPRLPRLRRDPLLVVIHRPIKMLHSPMIADPQTRAHILQHRHIVTDH